MKTPPQHDKKKKKKKEEDMLKRITNLPWNAESLFVLAVAIAVASSLVWAGSRSSKASEGWQGQARDAWVDGKIEASFALNHYLNPFSIDTQVEDGVVRLRGRVDSEIDKSLAEEIARGVDGVAEVQNELVVEESGKARTASEDAPGRSFARRIADANTTARVKLALLTNGSTDGLSIDVDTENGAVSLEGAVDSAEQRELAGRIAANTEGVVRVENRLELRPT